MGRDTDIIRRFPTISHDDFVRDEVTYTFDSSQDLYHISKGPAHEVYEVYSGDTTFVEDTDYSLVDSDGDGLYESIDWSIGGSSPSDGDTFVIDQKFRSVLARYLESHNDEIIDLEEGFDEARLARQISTAEGEELERIGAFFGALGKRQGRNNANYRVFLQSIVQSFGGRGSKSGLKFAIAAAVGTTTDNIEIQEDFENLEYTILINNVDTDFISSAVNELAELADPSGVELDVAIIVTEGNDIIVDGQSSVVSPVHTGLGGETLTMDGNSTLGGVSAVPKGDPVP